MGLRGEAFTMHKFRSMVSNAEMLRAELAAYNEMGGPAFNRSKVFRWSGCQASLRCILLAWQYSFGSGLPRRKCCVTTEEKYL